MSSFCRACLASDIKMYSLENSISEIYFEKLLQNNSKPPERNLVCYICYALLQRCHSFLLMARYSENMLQLLHNKGVQATQENIGQNPLRFTLSRLTIQAIDNTENDTVGNGLEPIADEEIKLEPTCTDIPDEECIKNEPIESPNPTDSPNISDAEANETVIIDTPPVDIETLYTCIPRSDQCQEKEPNVAKNKTHNQVVYSCHQCDKILCNKRSITRHIYTHIGYKPFRCDICHKKFTNSKILTIHMQTHNEIKPFKCHICDKTFSLKAYLSKHLKEHALTSLEKITYCSVCNKKLRKSYLSRHMKIHQGTEICYCDYCNKKFFFKTNLRKHLKTHEGQSRPFACHWCDKSFTYKSFLTNHEMTHTNAKPFECEVCKKTFSRKPSLNVHMRLHTGEKPYGCSKCDKKFRLKFFADNHERTHTGERPFSCEKCLKRFTQKNSRATHMKKYCKMSGLVSRVKSKNN